jgi:hypothetical protein
MKIRMLFALIGALMTGILGMAMVSGSQSAEASLAMN